MSKGASRLINLIKLPQRGALSGGRLVGDCWLGWSDLAFFCDFLLSTKYRFNSKKSASSAKQWSPKLVLTWSKEKFFFIVFLIFEFLKH